MNIAVIFFLFSAVFIALAVADQLKKGSAMTPARKTWLIVGVIFGLVAVANLVL